MNNPVCTRFALIKHGYIKCRHFSRVSSVINYGNCREKQKQNKLYNSIYTVQTRFESTGLIAKLYSPDNPPIAFAMKILESIHITTGLPWWGTIILTTATLRTFINFPLAVYIHKNTSKLHLLRPELMEEMNRLHYNLDMAKKMHQKAYGKDLKVNKRGMERKIRRALYRKHRCHPVKPFLLLIPQIPIFLTLSVAIRCLCGMKMHGAVMTIPKEGFYTEGLFWFTNLTLPDTTLILPITLTLLNLALLEIHPYGKLTPTFLHKFWRGLIIVVAPIAALVPSGVSFYWTVSSFFGVIQNVLLALPKFRQLCGIPKSPSQSETPFKDIFEQKKKIFTRKTT